MRYIKNYFFSSLLLLLFSSSSLFAGTESEYNSNKYNANAITENSVTTGNIKKNNDDFFKFTPTADSTITIVTSDYSKKMSVLLMQGCAYDSVDLTSTTASGNGDDVTINYAVTSGTEYCIDLSTANNTNRSYTLTLSSSASATNTDPTFTSTATTTATQDSAYSYNVTTNDADEDSVTLTGTTIPSWLSFDGTTLSGTPDSGDVGDHSVVLTADDGNGGSATQSFTITVSSAPSTTPIVENGDDLCYDTITYDGIFCIDLGGFEGGIGCTQTIPIRNQGTGTLTDVNVTLDMSGISGSIYSECGINGVSGNCSEESDIDMGSSSIAIFDRGIVYEPMPDYSAGDSHSTYATSLLSVAMFSGSNLYGTYLKDGSRYIGALSACSASATNTPPVADAGADQTINEGDGVTLNGSASTDSDGTIASYSWDDGNGHTATGERPTISGLTQGSYTFTLTVTDDGGDTDTDTVDITVNATASCTDHTDEPTCSANSSCTWDGTSCTESTTTADDIDFECSFKSGLSVLDDTGEIFLGNSNSFIYQGDENYDIQVNPDNLTGADGQCYDEGGTVGQDCEGTGTYSIDIELPTFPDMPTDTGTQWIQNTPYEVTDGSKNDVRIEIGESHTAEINNSVISQLYYLEVRNKSNVKLVADTSNAFVIKTLFVGGGDLIVEPGTYYIETFTLQAGGDIIVQGTGDGSGTARLLVKNTVQLNGGTDYFNYDSGVDGYSQDPSKLFIASYTGDVNIQASGGFAGYAYAPNGDSFVGAGSTGFAGAITANNIELQAGVEFYYLDNALIDDSCVEPVIPNYQNNYSCDIFSNVLVTYDSIVSNGNNDRACSTENIAYPEGTLTGEILCDPDASCGGTSSTCDRIDPPANRFSHSFPANSKEGTTYGGGETTLDEFEYGTLTYSNKTVTLAPTQTYADDSTKIMLLGDVSVEKTTLNFEPGDYYFDSLTIDSNNNEVRLPSGGIVRIFIKGDFSVNMNNLDFNTATGSSPDNLFVYVNGDFNSLGNGGGTTSWKAFMYVEGAVTLNNNSNNWEIYGGITAEGRITIGGNNPDFIGTGNPDSLGYGGCTLCIEQPSGVTSTVTTKITNKEGGTLNDLNISKAFSYTGFNSSGQSIDSDNGGATASASNAIDVAFDGIASFPNSTTASGFFYSIGDYSATQQDTLEDTTDVTFALEDYNTSNLDTLKILYLAEYMDEDHYYNVMIERCSDWGYPTYLTGPYDAWDTFRGDVDGDTLIDDKNISTKIQNEPFELIIGSLDETHTMLETKSVDSNVTYALYDSEGNILSGQSQLDVSTQSWVTANYTIDTSAPEVYVGFKFCASYENSLYTLADDSECSGDIYSCTATTATPQWHLCYSSDAFAIRPASFTLSAPAGEDIELLSAGAEHNFTMTAITHTSTTATDYNQTSSNLSVTEALILSDDTVDSTNILHGTLSFAGSDFTFVDGTSSSVGVAFDDVGKVSIEIEDQEWSSIDNDDTPQSCDEGTVNGLDIPNGAYICGDTNATFIPDHFAFSYVRLANNRTSRPFTYVSSDLNMSATIEVQIQAENANNVVTQNFTGGTTGNAYENPISLTLTLPTLDKDGTTIANTEGTALTSSKQDIQTPSYLTFTDGVRTLAWNESNSSQRLMFNYDKEINVPVNPIDINFTNAPTTNQQLNVEIASTYTAPTSGATALLENDANATGDARFYYARTRASKSLYSNITGSSVGTPTAIDIYCDLGFTACNALGIDTIFGQTNEFEWWINTSHSMAQEDGNITLVNDVGTLTPTTVSIGTDGVDRTVTVGSGGVAPLEVSVDLVTTNTTDTSEWLIYNSESAINAPSPLYRVRFINVDDGWAGVGNTGHVLSKDANSKTPNRVSW